MFIVLTYAKDRAQEIADFASKPKNWYRPGTDQQLPGDQPEYILVSGTVRAVFSWTELEGKVFRHLTISNVKGFVQPFVAFTLAHFFGFTGGELDTRGLVASPALDWSFTVSRDRCVALAQEVTEAP